MTDKRVLIAETALDLVREDGLAACTQPRVAQRSGLRQSHLTYYFPTRTDLLVAMTDLAVRHRVAAIDAVATRPGRQEKTRGLAELLADPQQTRVLLALTQLADTEPALREAFSFLATGIEPAAAALLHDVGAAPTSEAFALLQTISTGLAVVALATGQPDPASIDRLLTHLLDALPKTQRKDRK